MAVNNSEANYPPPVSPQRRLDDPEAPDQTTDDNEASTNSDVMGIDQIGALMAMNIGLDEPDEPDSPLSVPAPISAPPPAPPEMRPTTGQATSNGQVHHGPEVTPPLPPLEPPTPHAATPYQSPVSDNARFRPAEPAAPTYDSAASATYEPIDHPEPVAPSLFRTAATTAAISDESSTTLLLGRLFQNPWNVVGAAVGVLLLVASISWVAGSADEPENQGGSNVLTTSTDDEAATASAATNAEALPGLPPLSPTAVPPADQPGLVALGLDLLDPYTGRGTTGSVELFLNAVTGQVCHQFDADVLTTRYRAYIHEAAYPREGPSVVDLGETTAGVSQCVMASPIELARIMTHREAFYVAAHSPDREVLLRGQVSAAITNFDNRDKATIAEQTATAEASQTTPTTEADADALFVGSGEGAYLIVDAGRVTFEGAVADVQTASRLQAAFIPLAGLGVDVVDNLVVEAGAPAPSGRVVVADALLFASGQDQVDGNPLVLTTLADLLRVNSAWTATITGHTDDIGEWLFNVDLSLRRANNVRTKLAELGVPAERVRVQGAGPEQPIADNQTPEGRARNRRIEISISSGD